MSAFQQEEISGVSFLKKSASPARGTIVFVHGLGESGQCFSRIARHSVFSEWSQIIPDLSGYGRSRPRKCPRSLEEHSKEILSLISKLGAGQVVLVGHSMGGVIGQIMCEEDRKAIRLFLNVEGNISPQDCHFSSIATAVSLTEFLEEGFESLLETVADQALFSEAKRSYHRSLTLCDPRAFHFNSQELVTLSESRSLAGRLAELDIPFRYIGGLEGGFGPESRDLLSRAGVNWIGVEKAGHWPFWDQPEAFAKIVSQALSRLHDSAP